jgi:PleD family two-component response regulator
VRSRGRLAAADVRLTQGLSVIRQAGMALVDRHDMRVVIVDDRAPFREAARAVLEAMVGFAVVGSAETGEEGLLLARSLRPDLVILDVNPLV